MRKIVHLIPYDGIGGVEVAARSMGDLSDADIDFEVRFIFPSVSPARQWATTFNPLHLVRCARDVARSAPDVVILSLWRSVIVGLLLKIFHRKSKLVLFVHSSKDEHFLDFLFTRLALFHSAEVWADSAASVDKRFRMRRPSRPLRVISFLTHHITPNPLNCVRPVFVFWGRLSAEKNLGRALRIFGELRQSLPESRFIVIGPDGGELKSLKEQCQELDLLEAVDFSGPLSFQEITNWAGEASFYLQTSRYEGMAMSVVEAMQLGLVPIVTPVGEIANYCKHRRNALVLGDVVGIKQDVLHLLRNRPAYEALRNNAIATWSDRRTYSETMRQACLTVLGKDFSRAAL